VFFWVPFQMTCDWGGGGGEKKEDDRLSPWSAFLRGEREKRDGPNLVGGKKRGGPGCFPSIVNGSTCIRERGKKSKMNRET